MKKLIITLTLALAPGIAAAELTTITGDDDLMQISTITDRGDYRWKTLQRVPGGYVQFDDTGEMHMIQDFRDRGSYDRRDRRGRDDD